MRTGDSLVGDGNAPMVMVSDVPWNQFEMSFPPPSNFLRAPVCNDGCFGRGVSTVVIWLEPVDWLVGRLQEEEFSETSVFARR